jgi:hypothetical protein
MDHMNKINTLFEIYSVWSFEFFQDLFFTLSLPHFILSK